MRYLKKFNEMLDPMGSWNPSQLYNDEEFGDRRTKSGSFINPEGEEYFDDEDDEEYDGVPSNYCPECDCIPCQCTGEEYDEDLRESQHKEGTFAYYNAMTKDELKSLEKSFKHDFENPAQHDPKFVAYLKACELKKVFVEEKKHTTTLKDNNYSRGNIY
jgi:hypothetical protein